MKVVYNACYGGFGLSEEAIRLMTELKGKGFDEYCVDRDDPDLVKVVEDLGKAASGSYSQLTIEEIPDGVEWEIDEYDGFESVVPPRKSW